MTDDRFQTTATLAERGIFLHTPSMTLKSAAFLAMIGTILVTALLVWDLIFNTSM